MTSTLDTRTPVTSDELRAFRRDGYLVRRGALSRPEVDELLALAEALRSGDLARTLAFAYEDTRTVAHASTSGAAERVQRAHMLHRELPVCERYLRHPGLVEPAAGLLGPDVLGLQTMLFVKPPGAEGQGWHQDSYYLPTYPDTLLGAWVALDPATVDNGCLWVAPGSQFGPVLPDAEGDPRRGGDGHLADVVPVRGASDPDDRLNGVAAEAARYEDDWVPVELEPGDVVLFGGVLMHRSLANTTADRSRRAFVAHYCSARSAVQWDHDEPYDGPLANPLHVLVRGDSHLPYGLPRFAG